MKIRMWALSMGREPNGYTACAAAFVCRSEGLSVIFLRGLSYPECSHQRLALWWSACGLCGFRYLYDLVIFVRRVRPS